MLHHGVGRKTIVREEVEARHLSYQDCDRICLTDY